MQPPPPHFGRRAPPPPPVRTPSPQKRTIAIVIGSLYLAVFGAVTASAIERHRACVRDAERDPAKDPDACSYFSHSNWHSSSSHYYSGSSWGSRSSSSASSSSHGLSFGGFGGAGHGFGGGE